MTDGNRQAGAIPLLDRACRALAITGAGVLFLLSLITVVSVMGRYLFGRPIHGDFEMVEMGCAIATALFLPYGQLRLGNVIVDFMTARAPGRIKRTLDTLGCLLLGLMGGLLAWRLSLGGYDLYRYNDQTMVLQINTWLAYAVVVPCFALLCLAGLVTAWRAARGLPPPGETH